MEHSDAETAQVRNSKGRVLKVVARELSVPCSADESSRAIGEILECQPVWVEQDGRNEPDGRVDGEGYANVVGWDRLAVVPHAVELRVIAQRARNGMHEQRGPADVSADHRQQVKIEVGVRGELWDRCALRHLLGDRLPHRSPMGVERTSECRPVS